MRDAIEGLAICLSVGIVFMPLIGFLMFNRYINHKEKKALREISQNDA